MNATVKRKFNALLQGIGNTSSRPSTPVSPSDSPTSSRLSTSYDATGLGPNPSSSSLSNMIPEFDLLAKKRRVGVPDSSPARFGSIHLVDGGEKSHTSISNVTLRKWTPTGTLKSAETISRYCPGDRDQLLKRLGTFQELTDWAPKPERVSEIEWAKRGWSCQGKERVKCALCNKELAVKLNCKEVRGKEVPVLIASDIEEALVDKYAELIVTAHEEDCLWRRKGCDDSLLRLVSLQTPNVALEGLRQRYDELCARKDFLPYEFNLRLPEGLSIDSVLSSLPSNFFTEPAPPPDKTGTATRATPKVNRSALALAVLGWQGLTNTRIGAVPNSASCHSCLRRLGLWMFKSKEVDLETNTILVPAPMDHLDPLREHRFFCPWKSGRAQRSSGAAPLAAGEIDKPAWEILVQTLRNDAFVRRKTSLAATPSHGRSKSSVAPTGPAATPTTPVRRPTTAGGHGGLKEPIVIYGPDGDEIEEELDDEAKKKKDKDMIARLRRVKSLFNTKAGNKLRRTGSRPGTSHSTVAGAN
ncbi:zf-C3HC-domain-containing protein [Thozetella sp. PMI_491]|nr:zf-C3HC-domain-containing protein [Thozetella sp. PMI_491]